MNKGRKPNYEKAVTVTSQASLTCSHTLHSSLEFKMKHVLEKHGMGLNSSLLFRALFCVGRF